jgi:hypothetical protein
MSFLLPEVLLLLMLLLVLLVLLVLLFCLGLACIEPNMRFAH